MPRQKPLVKAKGEIRELTAKDLAGFRPARKALPASLKRKVCKTFVAADYLDDEETIAEYITAALEDSNPEVFLTAIRDVARARGMAQLAKDAGLGRESLYKALTPGAKPRYDTMHKLLQALGVKLSASPIHS